MTPSYFCSPDRRQHEVRPHRFERPAVMAVVDERSNGEGRRFHPNPEDAKVLAESDQRTGGEEREQTGHEQAAAPGALVSEVPNGVHRRRQEQQAQDREHQKPEPIRRDPARQRWFRPRDPDQGHNRHMHHGRGNQPRGAKHLLAVHIGSQGTERRHRHERQEDHPCFSSSSRAEPSESNSRLMWKTTIPMMNTPTNTSSSTPNSKRNGTRWVWVSPNTKMPFSSIR